MEYDSIALYDSLIAANTYDDLKNFAYNLINPTKRIAFIKELRNHKICFESDFESKFPDNILVNIFSNNDELALLDKNKLVYIKLRLTAKNNLALKNPITKIILQFTC